MPVRLAFDYDTLAGGRSDTVAVLDGATSRTFAELDDDANRVAHALLAAGLEAGDRVAYLGGNCLASVQLLVGAPRAGVVLTLLNWRLHPQELAHVLGDCGARLVVVTPAHLPALRQVPGLDDVRVVVVGGGEDDWEAFLAPASTRPLPGLPADRVVLQLYTSGTTGLPKGAMLTAAALSQTFTDTMDLWEMDGSSVSLLVLPLFHIIGIATVLMAVYNGSPLVLENDASPAAVRRFVGRHGVTHVVLVTVILDALAHGPTEELRSLHTISYGGSPIGEELLRTLTRTIGCRLVQIYGMTETAGALTALPAADHVLAPGDPRAASRLRSCGRARPGVELRIADPVRQRALPVGQVGEVQARTERLMAGYWQRPLETEQAYTDGWFRTGDLGELDEDGYLFLRDRLKDMIVSGAENVYPVEIERALLQHPAVQDVAVVGVPHERWGETPRALVVLRPGTEVAGSDLIAFAAQRLARYKCPTSVGFLDELPRNPSGKVLRRVLREPYWAGRERLIN